MSMVEKNYEVAKEIYAGIGVDTDAALESLADISISMQCWQGDDVKGFMFADATLDGGIQCTGNYPGRARNFAELSADIDLALSLIPGKHRLNLHAIYADTERKVDLDSLEASDFAGWIDFAKERGIALDFNPTCFSHPMASDGFTISSLDDAKRRFWIEHCIRCREIAVEFTKKLGKRSVVNYWFPDGYKDIPADKAAPRERMADALDCVFARKYSKDEICESLESKLFGIGAESYTVASNEFALSYALSRGKSITFDSGHFHPTEVISDKISAVMPFIDEVLLHVSRPVRWDSDHVVIYDDELRSIACEIIRGGYLDRVNIGLDYFDGSISRVAAWVIGMRSMQKALLYALLEPAAALKSAETSGDYTTRLALAEELKTYPMSAVWDMFCERSGVPVRDKWIGVAEDYTRNVIADRG